MIFANSYNNPYFFSSNDLYINTIPMQRIRILSLLLFVSLQGISQVNLESNMVFGGNSIDEPKDIAVSASKTSLFFGARSFSSDGDVPSNNGASDFWIMKRDIDGTLIWSKTFGGVSNDDLEVVMPHPDGGAMAFGTTRTDQGLFGDIQGLAGGWLMRVSNNGSITDGKIFGGSITETAVDAVRQVSGDIVMAMESGSPALNGQTNNGILDVWIVKVNSALTIQWTSLLGGTGTDVPEAIATDINGNIYVAATSNSNLPGQDLNQGGKDLWIIKISPLGETLWQRTFGGSEDEEASDILFHPDGFVYVMAHSQSADGDFGNNFGLNDLWMIKLNATNGDTEGMYQFGGSGNDFNGHADVFGDDRLVISTSTTSADLDITGNKGFGDVWFVTTDLNGNIQQQMNYGGSLNDLAVDIISVDSVFYSLSSTLSSDKNVPFNAITQQDLWYYTLNPFPDSCSSQFLCLPDSMLTNHLYPPANDALICVSGCNAGYGPGPSFNNGSCPDFVNATAYFYVTTDTSADLLTLSVSSNEFNQPQIALLKSVNCISFQQVECATGSNGNVVLPYIDIEPQTVYVIAITDVAGNIGEFEFCATSIDVEFCNEDDRIFATQTSMGSPLSGPYKPGEEVQICYELEDWKKLDCNGFQGLVPTFGPGWDLTSFDLFGEPVQTDSMIAPVTTGFWSWYKVGDVRYNVSNPINGYEGGQGMPAGWYFTNTADPPPADEPDQTTGDISNCLPTSGKWKVCFTLKVVEECESNLDCSISMKTFSDGEIGINTSLACAYDQEELFTANMLCCLNPSIQNIQNFSVCSGDTISFAPQTNLLPPVTYSWTADPDPFISGAADGNDLNQFYQILTTEAAIPLKVRYTMIAESTGCITDEEDFEITVLPLPTSRISVSGPNIVCSGSTVTFNFESTGTPPFAIGLFRDNELFANVLSESNFLSIPIDPVFSGRFRIGTLSDAFCDGQGTGFVNVTVKPISTSLIDTTLCEGQSFFIGDEEFDEAGTFTVTLEDGAENNCDSTVILTLNIAPTITETIDEVICNGDTLYVLGEPYTETTNELIEYTGPEGCPNFIDLHLLVKDTFSMDVDQTICNGDTLDFGGIQVYQEGTYSFVEEVRPGCFEETVLHLSVLPAIFINDLAIIGDNGSNSGAILVEIVGGSPPFQFLWNTGQTSESLFNIAHGTYKLSVSDRLGCTEEFTFVVPMISGTEWVSNEKSLVKIWPTITSAEDNLQLIYSGTSNVQVTSIAWCSVQGNTSEEEVRIDLGPGTSGYVHTPGTLAPGIYFVRLTLSSGDTLWTKIMLTD
jgi:hypothetical protein